MNNAYIRAQQCKVKEAKFPFVKIGSQYWTKRNLDLSATPQGNPIPEVQANGNIEKVVNGGFDTDTAWAKGAGWTISGGLAISTNGTNMTQPNATLAGRYYKITIIVSTVLSGNLQLNFPSSTYLTNIFTANTYTYYRRAIVNNDYLAIIGAGSFNGTIDSVSIQEIGWSGSQELYDGIYAQTAGTVEQKTYAAVKAAAMWCNYNNDAPTGLIYGKLYNWFALKLFQMDIDYYNAANPNKKWANGFRMPTQTEFQTLSTYLGGDAVSGGHLKEAGTTHWTSPNTGADNSSGFSALGSGYRNETGIYSSIYGHFGLSGINQRSYISTNNATNTIIPYSATTNLFGFSLRLIKA